MSNDGDSDNAIPDEFDDGAGFDDFSGGNTLGDLWRNNPMVKIGTVLAALAVIVGGIVLFGGGESEVLPSAVKPPPDITEAPGTGELSETYRQAIEERNIKQVEEALRTSGSAFPMATEAQRDRLPLPAQTQTPQEDPLERWRLLQQERERERQRAMAQQRQMLQVQQAATQAQEIDTGRQEAVTALANAMAQQMSSILETQGLDGSSQKVITSPQYLNNLIAQQAQLQQAQLQQAAAVGLPGRPLPAQQEEEELAVLVPAGNIEYAQLVTEATTDAPGPVLAEIVAGPLRGSRVLGSFTATDSYLVLEFNTVVVDGISQSTQAVALDPDKANPGVISEVDRRYFKRFILPMAADFIEGLTRAVSDSGRTSITITGEVVTQSEEDRDTREEVASGIAEAGEELGNILEREGQRIRPLLRVKAGTPIGILFLQPVLENG